MSRNNAINDDNVVIWTWINTHFILSFASAKNIKEMQILQRKGKMRP